MAKKGSKSSFQQQRKIFCRKFRWHSMKVLQINLRRLKLFGCSLQLLGNVQCTSTLLRLGGEFKLTPASYLRPEGAQMFKKSAVLTLHFAPSLRFTSLRTQPFLLAPRRWCVVCSPQSAVRSPLSEVSFYHRQGAHRICLCTGFTVSAVCFTYSDISLTMCINQW